MQCIYVTINREFIFLLMWSFFKIPHRPLLGARCATEGYTTYLVESTGAFWACSGLCHPFFMKLLRVRGKKNKKVWFQANFSRNLEAFGNLVIDFSFYLNIFEQHNFEVTLLFC